ncbi:MAG: PEP-CTERM sorting domain-containing protein, partial [Planctomycetota bacterium]
DGSTGSSGPGTAVLDSSNTLRVSIEVLSPDGSLVLPGFAVPEPASASLVGVALLAGAWRRRSTPQLARHE